MVHGLVGRTGIPAHIVMCVPCIFVILEATCHPAFRACCPSGVAFGSGVSPCMDQNHDLRISELRNLLAGEKDSTKMLPLTEEGQSSRMHRAGIATPPGRESEPASAANRRGIRAQIGTVKRQGPRHRSARPQRWNPQL